MKTTYISLILLLSTAQFCVAQRTSAKEERERGGCLQSIERRINGYADSLNFWTEGMILPKFIFNPRFDRNHTFTNDCLRDGLPFSYRKHILDRVSNIAVLKIILEHKDTRLDSLYIPTPEELDNDGNNVVIKDYYKNFPYRTHSTRYLVETRLKRIEEIKRLLEKSKK